MQRIIGIAWIVVFLAATHVAADGRPLELEMQRWVERIGRAVEDAVRSAAAGDKLFGKSKPPVWSVSTAGDEIVIAREKSAEMGAWFPNAPSADEPPTSLGEQPLRITLRFAPPTSMHEYERLAAINKQSADEEIRLRRVANLAHKFDDFIANTPEEKQRLKTYREAVAKLSKHQLPTFYAPEHSVYLTHHWHAWTSPIDKRVQAEIKAIEERLVACFGLYDDDSWSRNIPIGEYVEAPAPPRDNPSKAPAD